jgi:hypothetical protein
VRRPLALAIVLLTAATAGPAAAAGAGPGSIVFRCGDNLCRVAPDGSSRTKLTHNGRKGGPAYGWLSATRSGSRLGVVFGNRAYILNGSGKRVRGPMAKSGTVLVAQIRPDGRELATIELVPETLPLFPPSPPITRLTPYLYLASTKGEDRDTVARSTTVAGWFGRRLMRDDRADKDPFEQGICLLASNASFECERTVAAEAGHDLWGPVASPGGRLVAATRAPMDKVAGGIALYDAKTGSRVRTLTTGTQDSQPTWSPDGKRIAFARRHSLYVVPARGGKARRIAAGAQPVWVRTAPAR